MEIRDLIDELLIKIDYLKNYNEMIDIELDKIDGKVKIGHLRSLTHSLEKEINEVDVATSNIYRLVSNKSEE